MNLVETRELTCRLGDEPLFEDLNFALGAGEIVHLRGRNGSGKSTFIRSLVGQQVVDHGCVLLEGKRLESLSPLECELIAPLVDQTPLLNLDVTAIDNLIDCASVGRNLADWFLSSRRAIRGRVLAEYGDLVERFGLLPVMHRPARELSIGQRRLLTLLRALRARPGGQPRLLLLDEPLAGLRPDRVESVLVELRNRLDDGWAIIVAEHLPDIERLQPRHLQFPYRRERRPARPSTTANRVPESRHASAAGPRESRTDDRTRAKPSGPRTSPVLLSLRRVSAGYAHVVEPVVSNIDLDVRRGEVTAIVGPNAAGKSTLFRALFHDEQSGAWIQGEVLWAEQLVLHLRDQRHVAIHEVAWIPQERYDFPGMTVEETLAGALITEEFQGLGASLSDLIGGLRRFVQAKREAVLARVERLRERRPDGRTVLGSRWETLSGGERAMATVAMGLVNVPTVVLLDEPAANLDAPALEVLKSMLRDYVRSHSAGALLIEHRMSFLDDFADEVVSMDSTPPAASC